MDCTGIADLLKSVMGLDAASVGPAAIERAVQVRQAACGADSLQSYRELVRTSPAEQQALIEAVVVPETWFFRDRAAFAALAQMACEEWLPTNSLATLRLLSLPCSTGEEPYSIAMALLDAGVPPDRFHIDAVDISAQALAQARCAVYGRNSFRGSELEFRERYFEVMDRRYRLRDTVRERVQFHQGNVLAGDLLPPAPPYDAIFCRNLLIYFDRATQDQAVQALRRRLSAQGALFVGPSETGLMFGHDFTSMKRPLAFAFRKCAKPQVVGQPPVKRARRTPVWSPAAHRPLPPRAVSAAPGGTDATRPGKPATGPSTADQSMDAAFLLADQGQLVEAAECCESHLRDQGGSAWAFHLLGLIRAAAGNLSEAHEYYRKALYLDPGHYDTLLHLALLLEQRGDIPGAKLLRNRILRAERQATVT